jgi:5-methylcytosine-specific restriction protein A
MGIRITLHEELQDILVEQGNRWKTTTELAEEVNARGRYTKGDGSEVSQFEIHGRARRHEDIFERDGSRVRLTTA